jgi:GTP-binding protein HflX
MPGTWLLGAQPATDRDQTEQRRPRAVLLGLHGDGGRAGDSRGRESGAGESRADPHRAHDPLDELERLAETDGVDVAGRVVQTRDRPDPATYLGSGKVEELAGIVRDRDAGIVIADGDLSPAQVRNLEDRLGARVVDRTALILDIFAQHARSSEGRAQVELAQLAYQLPRLSGQGSAMSRVGGGRTAGGAGMGVRGPGEMRLETQRRHLRRRMTTLRRRVAETARRRERTRSRRRHNRTPSVAITGYTNAGKSALLNRLTGADGVEYTLADTVGFVRHLPHQLVDAFHSTLEEVVDADLILHVVDASAPDAMDQVTAVHGVLYEIGARDRPELLALNKIDVAPPEWVAALRARYPSAVPVSARTGEGIEELRTAIQRALAGEREVR